MQNWQTLRNHRKYKNPDGSERYVITIDGVDMEVNAEVYETYARSDRKERYERERDIGRVLSLERFSEDGLEIGQLTERQAESAEDIALHSILAEDTINAFLCLTLEERNLIRALVIGCQR